MLSLIGRGYGRIGMPGGIGQETAVTVVKIAVRSTASMRRRVGTLMRMIHLAVNAGIATVGGGARRRAGQMTGAGGGRRGAQSIQFLVEDNNHVVGTIVT